MQFAIVCMMLGSLSASKFMSLIGSKFADEKAPGFVTMDNITALASPDYDVRVLSKSDEESLMLEKSMLPDRMNIIVDDKNVITNVIFK